MAASDGEADDNRRTDPESGYGEATRGRDVKPSFGPRILRILQFMVRARNKGARCK